MCNVCMPWRQTSDSAVTMSMQFRALHFFIALSGFAAMMRRQHCKSCAMCVAPDRCYWASQGAPKFGYAMPCSCLPPGALLLSLVDRRWPCAPQKAKGRVPSQEHAAELDPPRAAPIAAANASGGASRCAAQLPLQPVARDSGFRTTGRQRCPPSSPSFPHPTCCMLKGALFGMGVICAPVPLELHISPLLSLVLLKLTWAALPLVRSTAR